MIRIAFCDDDLSVLADLSSLLDRYRTGRGYELSYTAYRSPLELMADLERGVRWDILLLDILMPGENGIELAREVRAYDENVQIIFLTSSPEFAVQSYTVNAFFYQLKPIHADDLFPVLDRVMERYHTAQVENLVLKCKTGITSIPPASIEYCEVINRSLLLHLTSGKVLESIHKLDELEKKLASSGRFLRVHRSYLVNMDYIASISYRAVTMRCLAQIPVPHGKYNELKSRYLTYAFEKEQVIL